LMAMQQNQARNRQMDQTMMNQALAQPLQMLPSGGGAGSKISGAASGALGGAATGAMVGGPAGAVVGGVLGGIGGLF